MALRLSIRPSERIALVGRTGSGKSFLARKLTASLRRLVVLDPKGTLGGSSGWNLVDWTEQHARWLLEGQPVRLRVPAPFDGDWRPFLATIYNAGNVTVYIDEAYGVVPPGKRPPNELNALYTRGRELGIGVWAATQRPSWIPLEMLSESEWLFCFRLQLDEDRARMAQLMGPDVRVPARDPHGFWLYNVYWERPRYIRGVRA